MTHNPIFSGTAFLAGLLCFFVMGVAGGIGMIVGWCRRFDEIVEEWVKCKTG